MRLTNSHRKRLRVISQNGSDSVSSGDTPPSALISWSASSRMTSTMSSMVMTPTRRSASSDHRRRHQVVALEQLGDVLGLLRHLDAATVGAHHLAEHHVGPRPHQGVEEDVAEQPMRRVDDEDLVELVGQFVGGGVAHHVDGATCGPERRHRDERRLHQPPGRVLREVERALQRRPVDRRQRLQDLLAVLLVEVLQQRDGIVAFEILHVERDRRIRQLLEDLLADVVVDLGQRVEVEVAAHDRDELCAQLRLDGLDQAAEIGFMEIAGELAQPCRGRARGSRRRRPRRRRA